MTNGIVTIPNETDVKQVQRIAIIAARIRFIAAMAKRNGEL
jgi:hypothetical protein